MAASMIERLNEEFSRILDIDSAIDTIEYLFKINDESDVQDYLKGLIDTGVPKNKQFTEKLMIEWRNVHSQKKAVPGFVVYQKQEEESSYIAGKTDKQKSKKLIKQNKQKALPPGQSNLMKDDENKATSGDKKKKFVPLFSQDGNDRSVIKLPGRHACNCQAAKHKLVNNCLRCGRIVCEQEGSGPCTFCGALVCSKEEKAILDRGSKKSDRLLNSLLGKGGREFNDGKSGLTAIASSIGDDQFTKAMKFKDRLLEYDRNCVKRTQVIDDECDYFSMDGNQWLSADEKAKLRKREQELHQQRHASRREQKITIDFAGRRVLEEEMSVNMCDGSDTTVQEVYHGATHRQVNDDDFAPLLHPNMPKSVKPPKFVDKAGKARMSYRAAVLPHDGEEARRTLRIQDAELMEMTDQGKCLSMHQPWASLLVAGIKLHEGRTWYTTHRGRLWIASTAKEGYREDIDALEEQYGRNLPPETKFPDFYPRSCLLGCVEVVDCLPQQEYREQYSDGESTEPYVFICRNARELAIKFPIQGQHKIYKLDSQTHKAAKLGILRDAAMKAPMSQEE